MHKVPHLYRNRLGTYYLRVIVAGKEHKRSLGTKDRPKAVRAALLFALARDIALQFDTTAVQQPKPLPLGHGALACQTTGEPMKNIPPVLRKGRGASDIDRQRDDSRADDETPSAPDMQVPDTTKKLDVLMGADGSVHITNVHSDEEATRAVLMARALKAGDFDTAVAMASPSVGAPLHLQPIAAMTGISAASRAANNSKPFSEVQALYLAEMKLHNSPKTCSDKASTYADFLTLAGDKLRIDEVSPNQAQAYKQQLLTAKLSAIRINTKISHLSELMDWAANNHHMQTPNPFKTIRVSNKRKIEQTKENYEPFTQAELATIFSDERYVPFMCEADYYWLPWLGLHTGARLEELASLEIKDVKHQDGLDYLWIGKGKNANSVRMVPMHPNLITAGFLTYVDKQKAKGATRVFPHLKQGKNGYSKNCSRRFGEYLDKLGITASTKVFHSFRATFITRMTEKNVHPAMLMALVGHYDQAKVDLSSPHFTNYQGAKLLKALKETVDLFDPGDVQLQNAPPAFRADLKAAATKKPASTPASKKAAAG